MSQKFIKLKNKNQRSTAYGKYFARAVYDKNFVGTKALADFIQTQASVNSCIGTDKPEDCGAQNITTRRVLFAPESVRVVTGVNHRADGTVVQKFAVAKNLVKDIVFEEAHENISPNTSSEGGENNGGGNNGGN